jgi:hypothetical protein
MNKRFWLLAIMASLVYAQETSSVILNLTKNRDGELILKISGHIQPLEIQFNGAKVGTLYVEDSAVNLSQLGIEAVLLNLNTAGGRTGNADTQAVIPPVNPAISSTPPFTTPF